MYFIYVLKVFNFSVFFGKYFSAFSVLTERIIRLKTMGILPLCVLLNDYKVNHAYFIELMAKYIWQ